AMLNYEVDPGLLLKSVPRGTELDSWNGATFLSLVGFRFLKTKAWGIAIPFHHNFEEVNLRFYVRRWDGKQFKRGVVFIREIVPRWLIAAVARIFYNERYVALPMSHRVQRHDDECLAEYRWKYETSWNHINLVSNGSPVVPENGSQQQFICEHYWGYAAQNDGGCIEYQVRHPQWKVWTATDASFSGSMENFCGRELDAVLQRPPSSALLAEGSVISVHRGRRL
ncbi:MAG TPA: DUF2071 domain-containing protein, partial [Ktedonobacteraceae bacterium]